MFNSNKFYILEPDLFEPKPVKNRIIIKRRPNMNHGTLPILSKRKLVDAFGEKIYNDENRYGQEIMHDFFKTNIGHGSYN